jgi:hypothetical protein
VTVTDGKLTVKTAAGGSNVKLCELIVAASPRSNG